MYRKFVSLIAGSAVIVATATSSICEANGEACLSSGNGVASKYGIYPQDVVLMQLRTRTSMPTVTWSESDPVLDEDFVEDDQPGGQDLTRPAQAASPNMTQVKVAQVQASQHVSQTPEVPKASTDADGATKSPSTPPPSESAEANVTAKPDDSEATPGVTTSAETSTTENGTEGVANSSSNSTNTSANATTDGENTTNTSGACATRADDRIKSYFSAAAPPGSPCVFGVDVRDENSHCIYEDGAYGSFGWCFTTSDRSEWGACNEHCPMYGPPSTLGKKIDNVSKKLDSVVKKLSPDDTSNEVDEASTTTEATPNEAAEAQADEGADAKGKGKGKGKEKADGDPAKGKGKTKDKGKS